MRWFRLSHLICKQTHDKAIVIGIRPHRARSDESFESGMMKSHCDPLATTMWQVHFHWSSDFEWWRKCNLVYADLNPIATPTLKNRTFDTWKIAVRKSIEELSECKFNGNVLNTDEIRCHIFLNPMWRKENNVETRTYIKIKHASTRMQAPALSLVFVSVFFFVLLSADNNIKTLTREYFKLSHCQPNHWHTLHTNRRIVIFCHSLLLLWMTSAEQIVFAPHFKQLKELNCFFRMKMWVSNWRRESELKKIGWERFVCMKLISLFSIQIQRSAKVEFGTFEFVIHKMHRRKIYQ